MSYKLSVLFFFLRLIQHTLQHTDVCSRVHICNLYQISYVYTKTTMLMLAFTCQRRKTSFKTYEKSEHFLHKNRGKFNGSLILNYLFNKVSRKVCMPQPISFHYSASTLVMLACPALIMPCFVIILPFMCGVWGGIRF